MALIAVIAVIAWALVLGDRYRRRMARLRGDADCGDTLERAVARTSWMRWVADHFLGRAFPVDRR